MLRNTVGVKHPHSDQVLADIVSKVEHKLGIHNFFGHGTSVAHKVKNPHVTVEQIIIDVEERMGDQYTEVFAKAVVSIKDINEYRGSR